MTWNSNPLDGKIASTPAKVESKGILYVCHRRWWNDVGHSWQLKALSCSFQNRGIDPPTSCLRIDEQCFRKRFCGSFECDGNGDTDFGEKLQFAKRSSSQTQFSMNSLAQIALHLRSCSSMFHATSTMTNSISLAFIRSLVSSALSGLFCGTNFFNTR